MVQFVSCRRGSLHVGPLHGRRLEQNSSWNPSGPRPRKKTWNCFIALGCNYSLLIVGRKVFLLGARLRWARNCSLYKAALHEPHLEFFVRWMPFDSSHRSNDWQFRGVFACWAETLWTWHGSWFMALYQSAFTWRGNQIKHERLITSAPICIPLEQHNSTKALVSLIKCFRYLLVFTFFGKEI